ncbi:MAG: ABC transporter permease [Lachnospiraceae bacterium]|nr:ABC transporter permease [Lachnospiraceae bacterium]
MRERFKRKMQTSGVFRQLLAGPYIVWMVAFIVIPLLLIAYYGFTVKTDDGLRFSLSNLTLIANPINLKALGLSLELSLISTIICLILAYPIALMLRNRNVGSDSFVIMIFMLPMWMNFLLRTIAWQNILEKTGVINSLLSVFGIKPLNLINTSGAIVFGMVYNFLPFMILPIYNVLVKIDQNVINAARDLGANAFQTFIKVILPLSVPGMISGITMVFVPSLTTFVISSILGGSKIVLIGNVIEQQFKFLGNWNAGSGLSLVLMIFILISMALVSIYDKDDVKGF